MDIEDLDEEKVAKPKKYAEIHITFWDDAEMDVDCVRYIKTGTGRGAPKKVVMLDKKEFMEDLDINIMTDYGIVKNLIDELKMKLTVASGSSKEDKYVSVEDDLDELEEELED